MEDLLKKRKYFAEYFLPVLGISDKAVLRAFSEIPREEFVPEKFKSDAYVDTALPIGEGQTISQPSLVALMTQLLKLKGNEKILEIGTGSGFQAAILSKIVKEVYTIERLGSLAETAKQVFNKLSLKNINVFVGDGTEGLPQEQPFDVIIVTAGTKEIPQPLIDQLKVGGRLLIPLGDSLAGQRLVLVNKTNKGLKLTEFEGVSFVPLIGKHSSFTKELGH